MKEHLYRITLVNVAVATLAACPSKNIKNLPETDTSVIKGPDHPTGTPDPIGTIVNGEGANYTVVSYNGLPRWSLQHLTKSLQSFRLGCEKLRNRQGQQDVCIQAMQAPARHFQAKHFFERYFTARHVDNDSNPAGTITSYYEPVLHDDGKPTDQSRFPIYGIPNDFASVPLAANLRGSKAIARIHQTDQSSGVTDNSGTYTADLSRFPTTARSTALRGHFEGSRFVPYYIRSQINGGVLNGKAPILGYTDDPVELFFMYIQGSGHLKAPSGKYIRVGFVDENKRPYVSIGRYMADKGYLPLGQTSMQGIKAYMK